MTEEFIKPLHNAENTLSHLKYLRQRFDATRKYLATDLTVVGRLYNQIVDNAIYIIDSSMNTLDAVNAYTFSTLGDILFLVDSHVVYLQQITGE